MATRNNNFGKFMYMQRVHRKEHIGKSTIYTLKDLMNDRKYIKALMAAKKNKKQQKKLVHVKLNLQKAA